jgi:hypothetical protein
VSIPPASPLTPSRRRRGRPQYYTNVFNTPCVSIPNMENWKCASLAASGSLSVASTSAIIAIVFLIVTGAFLGHSYYFRHKNKSKLWMMLGVK